MDWRNRKYYVVRFSHIECEYRLQALKLINNVRIHCPTESSVSYDHKYKDEAEPRGYYQYLIGCNNEFSDAVEYELRKAHRYGSNWREIKQYQKSYSPYKGFPERRCDLNPRKRCNHCMDC